jgi:hypothetical protein
MEGANMDRHAERFFELKDWFTNPDNLHPDQYGGGADGADNLFDRWKRNRSDLIDVIPKLITTVVAQGGDPTPLQKLLEDAHAQGPGWCRAIGAGLWEAASELVESIADDTDQKTFPSQPTDNDTADLCRELAKAHRKAGGKRVNEAEVSRRFFMGDKKKAAHKLRQARRHTHLYKPKPAIEG